MNFLPMQVMQRRKRVEKHAARLGIPNGVAEWFDFSGGGTAPDAMLAGNIDGRTCCCFGIAQRAE